MTRVTAAPAADEIVMRLALALDALPEPIPRLVAGYTSQVLPAEQWAEVADLVRLGVAAYAPADAQTVQSLGWALTIHARIHLLLGTSRTISGWYGPVALDQSLAGGRVGSGARAYSPPAHFGSSFNGRLRAIGRTLVPATPPPPKKFGGYDPQAPLSAAELDEVFDFCDAHRSPRFGNRIGERLARLVWLICGTGAKNVDLVHAAENGLEHVRGTAVEVTAHAVVFTTVGPAPRRIPVLASCEAAVLDAALSAGARPLLDRLPRSAGIADDVIHWAGWKPADRFPLTAGRLRQTWLAAVLAAAVPYPAMLRAAGLSGERNLAALVARLPVLDAATYETVLRCGTGPLPIVGQLQLPGLGHPVPHVPLVERP